MTQHTEHTFNRVIEAAVWGMPIPGASLWPPSIIPVKILGQTERGWVKVGRQTKTQASLSSACYADGLQRAASFRTWLPRQFKVDAVWLLYKDATILISFRTFFFCFIN